MKISERVQQTDVQRMKALAGGLLLLMACVFVASSYYLSQFPMLSYVRAFSEAAMVGALADWFAVTALFRRPLGLPIPHTAILPANKDRIGENLGAFVEENFLSPELIAERIDPMDLAGVATDWLKSSENSKLLSERIAVILPGFLDAVVDEDLGVLLERGLQSGFESIEISPFIGSILDVLVANNKHQILVDELLNIGGRIFDENKHLIKRKVREETPWFVPDFIDLKIYDRIVLHIENTLINIKNDPLHEARVRFACEIRVFVEKLKSAPEYREFGELIKKELLQSSVLKNYIRGVLEDLRRRLTDDLASDASSIRGHIERIANRVATGVENDAALKARLNSWLKSAAVRLVRRYRHGMARLIADTVKRWDTGTMVDKFELEIGSDLQFIRINGTVVGGLVGLLIHAGLQLWQP